MTPADLLVALHAEETGRKATIEGEWGGVARYLIKGAKSR
jgi:hypothetical protein